MFLHSSLLGNSVIIFSGEECGCVCQCSELIDWFRKPANVLNS
jgi:hypothetical protein